MTNKINVENKGKQTTNKISHKRRKKLRIIRYLIEIVEFINKPRAAITFYK